MCNPSILHEYNKLKVRKVMHQQEHPIYIDTLFPKTDLACKRVESGHDTKLLTNIMYSPFLSISVDQLFKQEKRNLLRECLAMPQE